MARGRRWATSTRRAAIRSRPSRCTRRPCAITRTTRPSSSGSGTLLLRLGRYAEAQARIEQLAEAAPRNAGVWLKLGVVYYEQKMWDRASDAFRRTIALDPTNMRARYFLATTYMDGGKDAEAAPSWAASRAPTALVDARVQLGFPRSGQATRGHRGPARGGQPRPQAP
jgi:Flp pilus assembly protein TadD